MARYRRHQSAARIERRTSLDHHGVYFGILPRHLLVPFDAKPLYQKQGERCQ